MSSDRARAETRDQEATRADGGGKAEEGGNSAQPADVARLIALQRLAGNRAVDQMLNSRVQRSAAPAAPPAKTLLDPRSTTRQLADAGIGGPAGELPHRATLEASLGTPLDGVKAHVGPLPSLAAQQMGARAFTHRGEVAFAEDDPAVSTVAHEIAHLGQTGHVDIEHSGQSGAEDDAAAVAARATSTTSGESTGRGPVARQAPDEPLMLTERQRQQLSGIVTACLGPLGMTLRMLGMSITGAAVGFRQSATAAAGVAGSVGVDEVVFVDPIRWEITGDVVPYAELGIGLQAGASLGVVVALRISPTSGRVGRARESYEGGSISATLRALAGVGFAVSTPLLTGEEGWVAAVITGGEEAGGSISYSRGVSMVGLTEAAVAQVRAAIGSVMAVGRTVQAIGQGISAGVQQLFTSVFAIFDPAAWDLTGYTAEERAAWMRFGQYMQRTIRATTLERFLAEESASPPVPVSQRIASVGDVGIFILVSEAMRARFRRRMAAMGITTPPPVEVWPANLFNTRSYLQFLTYAMENRLLATRGSGGAPPPEVVAEMRAAAARPQGMSIDF